MNWVYSCNGSECKWLLASLGGREVTQSLDDRALVLTLTDFRRRAARWRSAFRRGSSGFAAYTMLILPSQFLSHEESRPAQSHADCPKPESGNFGHIPVG